jgi:hypothetical protein
MAFNHAGHRRLNDGSVLRLDFELGRWVGCHYRPNLTVGAIVRGRLDEVAAVLDSWAAASQLPRAHTDT